MGWNHCRRTCKVGTGRVPFTSLVATKYFKDNGITAEMIYIDGSHEYAGVLSDCAKILGHPQCRRNDVR